MRRIILFFQIIIMLPFALHAQNRQITGTVRDLGGSLPGAAVTEKGVANNGTITDNNGHFTLSLRGTSEVIVVRFLGYVAQEINVANKTSVDVTMQSNNNGLDEVTIIGFTPQK